MKHKSLAKIIVAGALVSGITSVKPVNCINPSSTDNSGIEEIISDDLSESAAKEPGKNIAYDRFEIEYLVKEEPDIFTLMQQSERGKVKSYNAETGVMVVEWDANDPLQLKVMMKSPLFESAFIGKNRDHFDELRDKITEPLAEDAMFPLDDRLVALIERYSKSINLSDDGKPRTFITVGELLRVEGDLHRRKEGYSDIDLQALRRDRAQFRGILDDFYRQKVPDNLRNYLFSLENYGNVLVNGGSETWEFMELQPEIRKIIEEWAQQKNKKIVFQEPFAIEKIKLSEEDKSAISDYQKTRKERLEKFSSAGVFWLPWNTPADVYFRLRDKTEGALVYIDSANGAVPSYIELKKPMNPQLERFVRFAEEDKTGRAYVILQPTNARLYLGDSFGIQQVAYEDFLYGRNSGFILYNNGKPIHKAVTTGDVELKNHLNDHIKTDGR